MTCQCNLCKNLKPINELSDRLSKEDSTIIEDFVNLYLHETQALDDRIADLQQKITELEEVGTT